MCLRLLVVAAALLAASAARAEPPAQGAAKGPAAEATPPAEAEDDATKPPPGSPADQALWATARQTSTRIRSSRAEASRLAGFARHNRLNDRLKAAAKASPAQAAALDAVRERLVSTWKASHEILSRRWPIDVVRGCHPQALLLESALHAKAAKGPRPGVEQAREDVKTCVSRADVAVKQLTDANTAFSGAVDESVKRLAEVEPPRAAAGAPKAPHAGPVPEAPKG
jgi:hypothetical protein